MKGFENMANYRRERINESIREELCIILPTVKDPRVSGAFISVTRVDCTADLKYAKVFFSVLGGSTERSRRGPSDTFGISADDEQDVNTVKGKKEKLRTPESEAKAGLDSAAGYIRSRLASTLNLRMTPELTFIPDDSIRHGAHINNLLKEVGADSLLDGEDDAEGSDE